METLKNDNMTELINQLNPSGNNYKTDVSIITLDDGLQHNYFTSISYQKDNYTPIGTAIMIMPYIDEVAQYWTKYYGTVVVSAKLDSQKVNTNSEDYFKNTIETQHKKAIEKAKIIRTKSGVELTAEQQKAQDEKDNKKLSQRFINDYYNYSFIGKVSRFTQKGKKFVIYLEDLGWKFMQKVPKEFRETYIANQSLDDAFQAMCEFMGIEFAYSIEDLNEYNFAPDGYSIQKDGETIEDVPSLFKEWGDTSEEEEEEEDVNPTVTGKAIGEDQATNNNKSKNKSNSKSKKKKNKSSNKKNSNNNKTSKSTNTNDKSLASSSTNKDGTPYSSATGTEEGEKKEEEDDTNSVQDKIDKFQEEFDLKVKDLFIGNTYYDSDMSNPILDYNKITITPKAPPSDTTTGAAGATGTANGSTANGSTNGSSTGGTFQSNSKGTGGRSGWYGGQLYENGKIVLLDSYINTLSASQAWAKAQQTGTYTPATIGRLLKRASQWYR